MSEINPLTSELQELFKEVPASCIPVQQVVTEVIKEKQDVDAILQDMWGNKSTSLLSDYKYGKGLALYGENDLSLKVFFKRFGTSICGVLSNEFQKRGTGSESLKQHYNILENCLQIISKEIEKKDLKDFEILAIIAALQGFLINYNRKAKHE